MVPKTARNARLLRGGLDMTKQEQRHPPFCGCADCEHALLPKDAEIRITTPQVRCYFKPKEWGVTTTIVISRGEKSFTQDSHMYNRDIRSSRRAYDWARANAIRIPTMTRDQIYKALNAAGVKISTHG